MSDRVVAQPQHGTTIAWPFTDDAKALAARATSSGIGFYGRPGAKLPWRRLDHPDPAGLPLVFLVVGRIDEWLRVMVPIRPNGSSAWIRLCDVSITETRYQIVVVLGARRLMLHWGRRLVLDAPVAVGRARTPTPPGNFYVTNSIKREVADPLYGTCQLGLSGFSEVLGAFNGGLGQLGIHGTGRPDLIGQPVTAGCLRLGDDEVGELSRRVPLGTPVRIRP